MMRKEKSRPVVATIEQIKDDQPDRNGLTFANGRPTVTQLRPMTFWEHCKYRLKNRFRLRKFRYPGLAHGHVLGSLGPGLNVGIEISEEQYAKLTNGNVQAIKDAIRLRGGSIIASLVSPPGSCRIRTADGDPTV